MDKDVMMTRNLTPGRLLDIGFGFTAAQTLLTATALELFTKLGDQAMNAQLQGFRYLERPRYGPDWAVRFQLQFLFPK